jgi:23S rRNA (adenine1618-N6)-methyltransferase
LRKINNLEPSAATKTTKPILNFGGHNAEFRYELGFVTQMMKVPNIQCNVCGLRL